MTYEYYSWETINLPIVSGDTQFIIYDHQLSSGDTPLTDITGIIYSGMIVDGYRLQNLNEILSQYVTGYDIQFETSLQTDSNSSKRFYIYYTQDSWNTMTYDIVIIIYNWSYEEFTGSILSDPISKFVDYRQFFLYTLKAGSPDVSASINVKLNGNLIDTFTVTGYDYYNYVYDLSTIDNWPGEFSYAYSYDFFVDSEHLIPGTYVTLTIGASTYYVVSTCYKYCLHYLNQRGGWDSMLFRGIELQTDDIKRLSYKKNYVSQSLDFNKVDYLTTISEKWDLNTSFMTDRESGKMMNLMASNKIYLQDLETSKIVPVNITNSSCEHKNYKNQGRKMSTYKITVSASQPKYRI